MINIRELERRWLKYKVKSGLLVGSIVSIIGALVYGGYYILFKLDFNSDNIQHKSNINRLLVDKNSSFNTLSNSKDTNCSIIRTKSTPNSQKELLLTPIIPIIDERDDEVKLKKSVDRVKGTPAKRRVRGVRVAKYRPKKRLKPKSRAKSNSKIKPYTPKPEKVAVVESKPQKPKIKLTMSSQNYMQIMKEKFYKNKNPRDAILIAKAYFRAGNYEEAKKWALRANSIDSSYEESWILFAKSKQMLGEKREALRILITYYKKSKSKRVLELIEKMKTESM